MAGAARCAVVVLAGIFAAAESTYPQAGPPGPSQNRPAETASAEPLRPLPRFLARPELETPRFLVPQDTSGRAASRRQAVVQQFAGSFYRKPNSREMKLLEPDAEAREQYRGLLAQKSTGIFKLVRDAGCARNARVLNVSEACLEYTMPGAGNSYSFRTATHRIRHLADITYSDGNLLHNGILAHGIIVDLGDVPIESVTETSDGMGFLAQFVPADDISAAAAADDRLMTGITAGAYRYGRMVAAAEGRTYAMRTIAYRGSVTRTAAGVPYNELNFDKRRDMLVVFRIVKRDAAGGLTIIWRELRSTDSPRLKDSGRANEDGETAGGI